MGDAEVIKRSCADNNPVESFADSGREFEAYASANHPVIRGKV